MRGCRGWGRLVKVGGGAFVTPRLHDRLDYLVPRHALSQLRGKRRYRTGDLWLAAVSRKPQVTSAVTTLSAELGQRVTWDEVVEAVVQAWRDEGTSPNLHQPPPTSTTSHLDLAPLGSR